MAVKNLILEAYTPKRNVERTFLLIRMPNMYVILLWSTEIPYLGQLSCLPTPFFIHYRLTQFYFAKLLQLFVTVIRNT